MKNLRSTLLGVGCLSLVTLGIGLLTSTPAPAAPPTTMVTVANTPLPVTGAVNASITNTPTVNISGTVPVSGAVSITNASIPVTGTVGVSGNTLTTPLYVRDVDNGHNPYEIEVTLTNDPADYGQTASTCNNPGNSQCAIPFTVPTGQRYVVEHVSAWIVSAAGETYEVWFDGDVTEYLVMTKQLSNASTLDTFTASQPMRVYVNPGRMPPNLITVANANAGNFLARVTLSGYLVPLP